MNFLFISTDFIKKGGQLCATAFQLVRAKYPEATLTIVGSSPPSGVLGLPGVSYTGYLRKTIPSEAKQFEDILSSAFALIHPTTMDTMGMVLIEAGYHGCPVVTTKSFGIPELVQNDVSGFLIEPPLKAEAFAAKMLKLCRDRELYTRMRQTARNFAVTNLNWESVVQRIVSRIEAG